MIARTPCSSLYNQFSFRRFSTYLDPHQGANQGQRYLQLHINELPRAARNDP